MTPTVHCACMECIIGCVAYKIVYNSCDRIFSRRDKKGAIIIFCICMCLIIIQFVASNLRRDSLCFHFSYISNFFFFILSFSFFHSFPILESVIFKLIIYLQHSILLCTGLKYHGLPRGRHVLNCFSLEFAQICMYRLIRSERKIHLHPTKINKFAYHQINTSRTQIIGFRPNTTLSQFNCITKAFCAILWMNKLKCKTEICWRFCSKKRMSVAIVHAIWL